MTIYADLVKASDERFTKHVVCGGAILPFAAHLAGCLYWYTGSDLALAAAIMLLAAGIGICGAAIYDGRRYETTVYYTWQAYFWATVVEPMAMSVCPIIAVTAMGQILFCEFMGDSGPDAIVAAWTEGQIFAAIIIVLGGPQFVAMVAGRKLEIEAVIGKGYQPDDTGW